MTGVEAPSQTPLACSVALKVEDDAMRMPETQVHDYARQFLEAHGDKAVAEVAQRACSCEEQGDNEQAETWRRIEKAMRLMRGPNES
jgi:hypothetical protein